MSEPKPAAAVRDGGSVSDQLQDVPGDSMVAWVLLLEGLHSFVHACQLRYLCGFGPACIALLPKHLGF